MISKQNKASKRSIRNKKRTCICPNPYYNSQKVSYFSFQLFQLLKTKTHLECDQINTMIVNKKISHQQALEMMKIASKIQEEYIQIQLNLIEDENYKLENQINDNHIDKQDSNNHNDEILFDSERRIPFFNYQQFHKDLDDLLRQ